MKALFEEAGYEGKNIYILNFPANNFYLQEPGTNDELLDGIKHVRPGDGYIPHEQTHFFSKSDVNGDNENEIYKILKASCTPMTETIGSGGSLFYDPIKATDITWNFNKFLVDKNGYVRYRFASVTVATELTEFIDELLAE